MFTERNQGLNSIRADLLGLMTICSSKIETGKKYEDSYLKYKSKVDALDTNIKELIDCANHVNDIYKNIKHYNAEHQQHARDILDLAILSAGDLVPDAGAKGIHLKQENKDRVTIVNEANQDINAREGSGYRVILGALLRYACLKAQPQALQLMVFDESFFALSDITMSAMKDIFRAMKKDIAIICVDQRRTAMDGITDNEYLFEKDSNGTTTVTKVF